MNTKPLKLVDKFIYLDSNISSTESNINIHIERYGLLLTGYHFWKSDLSNKIKDEFFQAVAMSVLLYGGTT